MTEGYDKNAFSAKRRKVGARDSVGLEVCHNSGYIRILNVGLKL